MPRQSPRHELGRRLGMLKCPSPSKGPYRLKAVHLKLCNACHTEQSGELSVAQIAEASRMILVSLTSNAQGSGNQMYSYAALGADILARIEDSTMADWSTGFITLLPTGRPITIEELVKASCDWLRTQDELEPASQVEGLLGFRQSL